ncbi:MAG: nucleoside triphosphate pyrophosphohydrolase family protein [Firmicutes bacterium]|nr:nucleoside triphosphate pyrophosphohydrolase family protein [Bacillota bacterium]
MKAFDQYQEDAKRTLNTEVSGNYKFANLGMGLAGEAGEVCDYLKKVVFHGHNLDKDKLRDELGDVLWYLANLAAAIDVPLSEIAKQNVAKLKKRYPNGFEASRSQKRDN